MSNRMIEKKMKKIILETRLDCKNYGNIAIKCN